MPEPDDAGQGLVRRSWDRAQAANDPLEARHWLERAHRLAPTDATVALALAGALLRVGELVRAAQIFRLAAERHGAAEAWAGLATAAHLLGQSDEARGALLRLLQGSVVTDTVRSLAGAVAGSGWCGLTLDGVLWAGPGRAASVEIDGRAVLLRWAGEAARLPAGWRRASAITVKAAGHALLGSPLDIRQLNAVEGLAESSGGGITGWAWHPADPARSRDWSFRGQEGAAPSLHTTGWSFRVETRWPSHDDLRFLLPPWPSWESP